MIIKLKDLISKSILEQVSTVATATGAKQAGYKSDKTDELEKIVKTATTDYETHQKAEPAKYQWIEKGKKGVQTGTNPPKGAKKISKTDDWEKWNTKLTSKLDAKEDADEQLKTSQEDDASATVTKQEPPVCVTKAKVKDKDKDDEDD